MAKSKSKKKKPFVRFELSLSGLLGVMVVSFCIFLWMFLLGIWAGQTILLPTDAGGGPRSFTHLASSIWHQGKEAAGRKLAEPTGTPAPSGDREADDLAAWEAEPDYAEPSFFALQLAALSDRERAVQLTADWKAKGYEAFFLQPDESGDGLYRVCVGRFEELAAANLQAGQLEEQEKVRAYITLVPVSRVEQP